MKKKQLHFLSDKNTITLILFSILIFVVMGILSPDNFLGITNLQGMCIQFPEFGIMAFGMMLCMISGGIDLSLVGIANLSGIIATLIMVYFNGSPFGIFLGVVAALLTGLLCGMLNGWFIGCLGIPPMLVTLCGLQLYKGIGLAITKGPALTGLPESFSILANGTLFGIPIALLIFIFATIVVTYLLNGTVYGQHLCYLGSNEKASAYSGINNFIVLIKTYGISGILGSISGIIMISHYNSAKADYGTTYTLLTLLIVVLGGTAPEGGKGKVAGVVTAVVLLQLVSSAFNIMRVNAYMKTFVWGWILILVMLLPYFGRIIKDKKDRK